MNKEETLLTLSKTIKNILELEDVVITPQTSAADIDEWDSMTHIQIISAIEGHYKIRFALGELQALKNVGDMIELIHKKLNK
jgi:acyl carrier protein